MEDKGTIFFHPTCLFLQHAKSSNSLWKITDRDLQQNCMKAKPTNREHPIRYTFPTIKHNILEQYQSLRCSKLLATTYHTKIITWETREM